MLSISLNFEENKIGVRASYKHFAATRLFSRQTPERVEAALRGLNASFQYFAQRFLRSSHAPLR